MAPIRPVALPGSRVTLPWLVRTCLVLSAFASFAQYALNFSFAPVLPLVGIAFCGLLVLSGPRRADRLQHILSGGSLMFAGMLFSEVVSYTSHDEYSLLYGLVFVGIFLCARLIVQEIGVANIARAYSAAGLMTVVLILLLGRRTLFNFSSRYSGGTHAHPNLLGFVMAGFFPLLAWRALEERVTWKKWVWITASVADFVILFMSGSRGSLGALLGSVVLLILRGVTSGGLRRFRVSHFRLVLFVLLGPLVIVFLLRHNRLGHIGEFLINFLSLESSQRGIGSGLSGRTGTWKFALGLLHARSRWLFGFGYRTGTYLVIDDGYIELLFENGLIAGGLIFAAFLRIFFLTWRNSSFRINTPWNRFYLLLWAIMPIYFLNNVSARFLFGFGNPFSLFVLMLAVASHQELVGAGRRARAPVKPAPAPDRRPAFRGIPVRRPI